jgi:hypothetical protein
MFIPDEAVLDSALSSLAISTPPNQLERSKQRTIHAAQHPTRGAWPGAGNIHGLFSSLVIDGSATVSSKFFLDFLERQGIIRSDKRISSVIE